MVFSHPGSLFLLSGHIQHCTEENPLALRVLGLVTQNTSTGHWNRSSERLHHTQPWRKTGNGVFVGRRLVDPHPVGGFFIVFEQPQLCVLFALLPRCEQTSAWPLGNRVQNGILKKDKLIKNLAHLKRGHYVKVSHKVFYDSRWCYSFSIKTFQQN